MSGAWTNERYFHGETSGLGIPQIGEVAVADTFVNVRKKPSAYNPQDKMWHYAQMVGVVAPQQRIKVDDIQRVNEPPGDPITRIWIYGGPAP